MAIINNTYFVGKLFLPHATPSITDDVTEVASSILDFIDEYENECLVKCLGYKLAKEFTDQLDSNEANGLKSGVDVKWDHLLNGREYTDPSGELVKWPGVRFKSKPSGEYNRSFLANYVYYYYESDQNEDRVGVGNVQQKAENASIRSKTPKVIKAWREFYKMVQDHNAEPRIIQKFGGVGIDWYGHSGISSLYRFINDSNVLAANTYEDFRPSIWYNKNQAGI